MALELPYIQSDIVTDPYVRLFVPYRPRRHNTLLERRFGLTHTTLQVDHEGRHELLSIETTEEARR